MSETTGDEDYWDRVGLGGRKGAEVVDNLEGEMSRRRNTGHRMRRGGGYVLGIAAGNKLVCCREEERSGGVQQ